MTVIPATVAPGQRVTLRFPSGQVRGIAFALSTWGEKGWTVAYYLTSDWGEPGDHTPDWWSVEDEEQAWAAVGIEGRGAERVIVPDSAPAGEYLLCTPDRAHKACARVTVTG